MNAPPAASQLLGGDCAVIWHDHEALLVSVITYCPALNSNSVFHTVALSGSAISRTRTRPVVATLTLPSPPSPRISPGLSETTPATLVS